MKVVTLMENTTSREDLACEHGLSLYIETGKWRILFDAGQTGAFAENAEKLGIDLRAVDFAVLSHGHYDHGGGLEHFLQINKTAPIYLNANAFTPHFNGSEKYIGLDLALRSSDRLVFTGDHVKIAEGIELYSCNDRSRPHPTDTFGLTALQGNRCCPDDFCHEQYLLIEEHGKRICFSGCSHKGILNIAGWFQPDVLIGGFHFVKLDPEGADCEKLKDAANSLLQYPTSYYTGHCTGSAQFAFMKKIMKDKLQALSAGSVLQL